MTTIPFVANYPGAIVVPADTSNYYRQVNHGGIPNKPRGWVLHTPEEAADDHEVTPYYFQTPGLEASTMYYMDSDGDVYQMVKETDAAIANGVLGKPYPSWADPSTSLNWQSLNVEIEGYAASIQDTLIRSGPQYNGLIALIKHRAAAYNIPLDREHIIGHYQVSNQRSDPGAGFPWAALIEDLNKTDIGGEEMWIRHNRVSAWFSDLAHQSVVAGEDKHCNAWLDFDLPTDAKSIDIEIEFVPIISIGGAKLIALDGQPAQDSLNGYAGSQTAKAGEPQTLATRVDVSDGWFTMRATNDLRLVTVGCVAYYK